MTVLNLSKVPEVDPSCGCPLASVAMRKKPRRNKPHCVRVGKRTVECFSSKQAAKKRAREHNDNPRTRSRASVVSR